MRESYSGFFASVCIIVAILVLSVLIRWANDDMPDLASIVFPLRQ